MYKVGKRHVTNTNKAKGVLSSTGLSTTSSIKRPSNRDSSFKNSVVSNTKNSSEKVEVSDRTNQALDVVSKNVSLNMIVTNDEIKNTLIAKNVLCVSCSKNVLILCHDNCLTKYKLNLRSKFRRALFTTPKTVKSMIKDTTPVVSKTRFSVRTVQSKSLDTTPIVSKDKIDIVTPFSDKNKVVQIVLRIVDSGCSKHMMGLGHNLFSVGQFCDGDSEVAFQCLEPVSQRFIHNDSSAESIKTPSKEDLDNLFGPMYKEYFKKMSSEMSITSAAQQVHNKEDLPSTSSIVIEEHEAPPIVTTSEEQTSPISLTEADESYQEDLAELDGNTLLTPYDAPDFSKAESSTNIDHMETSRGLNSFYRFKIKT
ncbi:hypothetical protein Tco_0765226 [Tanacetum coccineum]